MSLKWCGFGNELGVRYLSDGMVESTEKPTISQYHVPLSSEVYVEWYIQGLCEYYPGTQRVQSDIHEYTKNLVLLEYLFSITFILMSSNRPNPAYTFLMGI